MVAAPQMLPAPLRAVLHWLVFDLILPEDDFTQALRKISSSILFADFPMCPLSMIFPAYQLATGAPPVGPQFMICCALVLWCTLTVNYVCIRLWKHVSDAQITIFFALVIGTEVMINHTWFTPIRVGGFILATFVALSRPSVQPLLYAVLAVDCISSIYNDAAPALNAPLLMFPGDHGDFEIARWATSLSFVGGGAIAVLGVIAQSAEHTRQLHARRTAQRMISDVVDLLRDYDTDGVTRALEANAADAVDPGLVRSLQQMNGKLLQYRPHLPNYVLSGRNANDGIKEDDRNAAVSQVEDCSRSCGPTRLSARESLSSSNLRNSGAPETALSSSTNARSTSMAALDLCIQDPQSAGPGRQLEILVDSIFRHAGALNGSVHSLLGDTALVSWNASSHVSTPGLNAGRFLCRVASDARAAGCCVAGAACTGEAECDLIEGSAGLVAQLLSPSSHSALHLMLRLATRHGIVLVDHATREGQARYIEARAIDAFQPADDAGLRFVVNQEIAVDELPASDSVNSLPISARLVYQLLRERESLPNSDEHPAYTLAVQHLQRGEFGEALSALETTAESASTDPPLTPAIDPILERLCLHCSTQLLGKTEAPPTAEPTRCRPTR